MAACSTRILLLVSEGARQQIDGQIGKWTSSNITSVAEALQELRLKLSTIFEAIIPWRTRWDIVSAHVVVHSPPALPPPHHERSVLVEAWSRP